MKQRLRRLLLPLVLLGMQSCWLLAWLYLLENKLVERSVVAPVVILFMIGGVVVRTQIEATAWKRAVRLACYWVLWGILVALAGKLLLYADMPWGQTAWVFALPRAFFRLIFETRAAELLLLFGSGCAWYFGGRAASETPGHASILGQFQFGLLLLLGAFLTAHGLGVSAGHPALLCLAFFAFALTGLAVTRSRAGDERASLASNRQFTGSLLSVLGVVALLGLLAGVAITPDVVGVFVDAARAVFRAIEAAFAYLISLLPSADMPSGGEAEPATGDDSELREFYERLTWPALLRRVLFIGWTACVLGIFLFALWRACSMLLEWLKRRSNMSGVEVESLDKGLLADLIALLLWLDSKARSLAQRVAGFVRRSVGISEAPTWSSVYASLLKWAGRKLRPRNPSESASEYRATLEGLLPAAVPEIVFVTETYILARYGGREPDSSTVQEMQRAFHRIRKAPRPRRAGDGSSQTEVTE